MTIPLQPLCGGYLHKRGLQLLVSSKGPAPLHEVRHHTTAPGPRPTMGESFRRLVDLGSLVREYGECWDT
jgi:hypothetical protein